MSLDIYRTILKDPDSGNLYELSPKSIRFTEELNKEPVASFTFGFELFDQIAQLYSVSTVNIFTGSFKEIWIETKDSAGDYQKIFWGVLTNFELSPEQQGQRTFTVNAVGWLGLFAMRIAGIPVRHFTSTDAGQIAWTLIDESQNSDTPYSDYGISQGSITTSVDRDRTYRFDNIRDSIIALSNSNLENGFDFDIDNTKAFNVYYPYKGNDVLDVVMDDRTTANYMYKKPLLLSVANKIHVLGGGFNDDLVYVTRTGPTGARSAWKTQEKKVSDYSSRDTALLNDKGDKYLENYEDVELTVDHYDNDVRWLDYSLGDSIRVNLSGTGLTDAVKRATKRTFFLDENTGVAKITTVLTDPVS